MIDDIHAQYGRSNQPEQSNQTGPTGQDQTGPPTDQRLPSPQTNSEQSPTKNEPMGNLEGNASPGHMSGQNGHMDAGVTGQHSLDSMSSAMTQAFVPDNVQTAFPSPQGKFYSRICDRKIGSLNKTSSIIKFDGFTV